MGNYLVFAMTQEKTSTFYIDDIEITESSCRSARPTLSKLTHNSVRLAYSAEPTTMRVVLAKDYVFDADSLNAGAQSIDNLKEQGLVVLDTLLADTIRTARIFADICPAASLRALIWASSISSPV